MILILAVFEEILALNDLLGDVVEKALDLIDNTPIKLYRSQQSGRELFEVQGLFKKYRFLPTLAYCNCTTFYQQVLRGEEYCCKHYLAGRIAKALGKVEIVEKPAIEFRKILKEIQF